MMKIEPYSEFTNPNILLNIRIQMKMHFNPDAIRDNLSFDSYIKPWDKTEPTRDFLVAKDEAGTIIGWAGLFKSSKFWSGIGIFVSARCMSSSLPLELLDSIEKLAEAQELTNLRLYVHARFTALHEALHERGVQSRSGEYALILEAPETPPSLTLPRGIVLKSSRNVEDFTTYAETVNAAFSEYPSWQLLSEEDLKELDQDLCESGYSESIHFYAYDDQQLVGVIHSVLSEPGQEEKKGLIVRLGVIPNHRRRGIGNALLRAAIRWLLEKGCSKIMLDVIAENESALILYRNLGFVEMKDRTMLIYAIRPSEEENVSL